MQLENCLIKTLAFNKQVRILFVENTALTRAVCEQSDLNGKLLKTALGRTITAASLLSGTLKDHQRLSLKIKTSRPDYNIFADADALGNIRGYLSAELRNAPSEYLESISMEQLIGGRGCVQVIKDVGMNRAFTGITDMPYRNIVDDLSHYFNQSEQTPTCFAIRIEYDEKDEIAASQGIMAQLLPGAPDGLMERIGSMLKSYPFPHSLSELQLLEDIEIMSCEPVRFFCGCSKQMFYPLLRALGNEELKHASEKNRTIEMVCHICGHEYLFRPDEIAGLAAP